MKATTLLPLAGTENFSARLCQGYCQTAFRGNLKLSRSLPPKDPHNTPKTPPTLGYI